MTLDLLLYAFLFVIIGLTLVSFFLVWQWFDAKDRLKVVREVTREQTMHAIRHSHNKCRILLYIGILLALAYIPIPFLIKGTSNYYSTLIYPGVVILTDLLVLCGLFAKARDYVASIDEYVNANEEHVREAAAQREQQREQWRKEAADLNPKAQAMIQEALGDNYEIWYQHDILVGRNVLANKETGMLFVQGIVIPFSEIMEVRQGRKDLKLVTSNSNYPFITIDFGALPINPETGNRYKDEIAQKIEAMMA
ncbi:MAG: hypothetical protein II605_01090 [Paludibacteraceae bacterium]|nr:hypothetical protein [Paludibacteraceae bacterium]MBQ2190198.1 hypothetical protein [Paludibacteraceae bacterium]MBQ4017818.1 hypothetical protein [Paludibacteraceae bacterium]MBQ5379393.1 hypothetical protein [Paludibacteraceae bacterium]